MKATPWYCKLLAGLALTLPGAVQAGVGQAPAPPWSAPIFAGRGFTIPGVDNVPDLHGDINRPDLVVFFAGNQYMVVNDLIKAFRNTGRRQTRVFAETLPPGILARQIKEGSLVIGNMRISPAPDVYTAGRGRIQKMRGRRHLFAKTVDYARNRLAMRQGPGEADLFRQARPGGNLPDPYPSP